MAPFSTMTITFTLAVDATDDDLRKAREVLALIRSLSTNTDKTRGNTTDEPEETPLGGAAPAATFQAPAPAVAQSVECDGSGLPWDARIHSGAKAKNNDGSWKKRRGTQDSEVKKIEAELRATLAAGQVTSAAAPPPPPPATVGTVAAPPPPPPPPAAPPASANPFVTVLQKVTALQAAKKLTQEEIVGACQAVGVTSLPALNARPELIPAFDTYLDSLTAGR